jgi:hypothetical protein
MVRTVIDGMVASLQLPTHGGKKCMRQLATGEDNGDVAVTHRGEEAMVASDHASWSDRCFYTRGRSDRTMTPHSANGCKAPGDTEVDW